jgi:hypothetical protein
MPPGPVQATSSNHPSFVADHPLQAVAIYALADQTPILFVNNVDLATIVVQEIGGVEVSISEVIGYNKMDAEQPSLNSCMKEPVIILPDVNMSYRERLCQIQLEANLIPPNSNEGKINIQDKIFSCSIAIRADTQV